MNLKIVGQMGKVQPPTLICAHCKTEMVLDLSTFNKNIAHVAKDRCPKCNGEMFFTIIILGNSNVHHLMKSVQDIIEMLNNQDKRIIDLSRN